jgi:signal transduction histidine kinase
MGRMTAWPRRLLPDSLPGRLALFLTLGLAVLLGINMLLLDNIQESYARQTRDDRIGAAASRFFLFDPLAREQRAAMLARMGAVQEEGTWTAGLALLPSPPGWQDSPGPEQIKEVLLERFARKNLAPPRIRTRLMGNPPADSRDAYAANILANTDPARFPLLEVAMELRDGAWLCVIQSVQLDDARIVHIQRLQLIVVITLFTLLLLAMLVTVTRPLNRLAKAMEEFGGRPEIASPLPERGTWEVREAAHSFNMMRRTIQDHLAERDRMLAAMAHDLRTPLARLQLRLDDVAPVELRERLGANCLEIQAIVSQGMELARSLHTSESPVILDVRALAQSLADDAAEGGAEVRFHGSVGDPAVFVLARPLCLKRCVTNVLDNALRYAGHAEILLTADDDTVSLEILDSGPGIPEAELTRVFKPYYRLESSRNRESGGAGLGLAIARNMAILDGGVLALHNRPEGGLRVALRFPRARKRHEGGIFPALRPRSLSDLTEPV